MIAVIEHRGPHIRQELTVTKSDGTSELAVMEFSIDGGDELLLNGNPIGGNATWAGEELVVESWLQISDGRDLHVRDYWSLSEDAATLTMEHRDDDLAGQVTIFDRVG